MSEQRITIVVQTTAQSIASDSFSVAGAMLLIGVGVYAGSSAMQWAGFILFFTMMLSRNGIKGVYRIKSVDEARKILDEADAAE